MKVSEILRAAAFLLPVDGEHWSTDSELIPAALGGETTESSPYICDCLDTAFGGMKDEAAAAKAYLVALGMGEGFCVFDPEGEERVDLPASRETQYQRCTWLLFAADLWDEGFCP